MSAVKSCGGARRSSVTGSLQGVSGTPGSTGRRVVVLRDRQRGQRGRSNTGGEQLRRRFLLTCGCTGRDSGDGEVRVEGGGLGEMPGRTAQLLRSPGGARRQI